MGERPGVTLCFSNSDWIIMTQSHETSITMPNTFWRDLLRVLHTPSDILPFRGGDPQLWWYTDDDLYEYILDRSDSLPLCYRSIWEQIEWQLGNTSRMTGFTKSDILELCEWFRHQQVVIPKFFTATLVRRYARCLRRDHLNMTKFLTKNFEGYENNVLKGI